jgi:hypothetical protein
LQAFNLGGFMRFRFLSGDVNYLDYGGKWISGKLNNGDWDYWLVIELLNWHDAVGEREAPAKYCVELRAVSPQAAGAENIKRAKDCCGVESDDPIALVEALDSYGVRACLFSANGNNAAKLMREAREAAKLKGEFLFGFAMDGAQSRMGDTGWDFIAGDIGRSLKQ